MGKYEKLLIKILSGTSDSNIKFKELTRLMKKLGFLERIKGSHHIFFKDEIPEIINIQDDKGIAKSYQVKQVREIIAKHDLKFI